MELMLWSLMISAGLLILTGLVPSRWCSQFPYRLRDFVTRAAGVQALLAFLVTLNRGAVAWRVSDASAGPEVLKIAGVEVLLMDGISCLMFSLVSFIGWVICRYSIRFLDGEPGLGSYFRWTGLAIGSVSLMALSGNLLLLIAAWTLSSVGLHHLLMFYRERPAARRAAWSKFTVSRIGDLCLLVAAGLIYLEYQTLNFTTLFGLLDGVEAAPSSGLVWAVWLLTLGAAVKTAQFPFHTWLPQTLETPTPVSALMHAGIVNAGGYLLIRTSPLVQLVPAAMFSLVLIGMLTVCVAAVTMLTQNSIKRRLAYSTVAQMGFMILQCGLGAFSAAMLHLLAHSFYKAHAFLSSGSVLEQKLALGRGPGPVQTKAVSAASLLLMGTGVVLGYLGLTTLFGISPASKPGGILLGLIVCLALTGWLKRAWQTGERLLLFRTACASGLICLLYCIAFVSVDRLMGAVPTLNPAGVHPYLIGGSAAVIVIGFSALAFLNDRLTLSRRPEWMNSLYVHALNGFYIEPWLRQRLGRLVKQ